MPQPRTATLSLTLAVLAAAPALSTATAASIEIVEDMRVLEVIGQTTVDGSGFSEARHLAGAGDATDESLAREATSPTGSYGVSATASQSSSLVVNADGSFTLTADLATSASRSDEGIPLDELEDEAQGDVSASSIFDMTLLFDGPVMWQLTASGGASEGAATIEYFDNIELLGLSGGSGSLQDSGTAAAGTYRFIASSVESVAVPFPESEDAFGDLTFTLTGTVASPGDPAAIPAPAAAWCGLSLLGVLLSRRPTARG